MGFMKRTLMFPSLQLKKENQTKIYWEHFGESTQGPGITQRVSQDLSTTFKHRAIHLAFQALAKSDKDQIWKPLQTYRLQILNTKPYKINYTHSPFSHVCRPPLWSFGWQLTAWANSLANSNVGNFSPSVPPFCAARPGSFGRWWSWHQRLSSKVARMRWKSCLVL